MMFGILHMTRSRGCRGRGREGEAVGCGMEWNGRHRPLAASIGVLALSHTVQSHGGERRVGHDAHLPLSPPLPSARNGFPIPCSPARNRAGLAWKGTRRTPVTATLFNCAVLMLMAWHAWRVAGVNFQGQPKQVKAEVMELISKETYSLNLYFLINNAIDSPNHQNFRLLISIAMDSTPKIATMSLYG